MHLSIVSTLTGKPIPKFVHSNLNFALVPPDGGSYKLVIQAHKHHEASRFLGFDAVPRVEAVVSVDGLDVQDGKPASRDKRGLVFVNEAEILGWRIDNCSTATFMFAAIANSYAAQMGRATSNVGTIGLALYAEKRVEKAFSTPFQGGGNTRGMTKGGGSGYLSAPAPEVGTGFGSRVESRVGTAEFTRGQCLALEVIHYRTREWFQAAGIPVPVQASDLGCAFPEDAAFCAMPPGYKG